MLRGYSRSLQRDRRVLLDQYRVTHIAHEVVGVGSVGTRIPNRGIRVARGQHLMQAASGIFLGAQHGRMCAWTLARAHARSGDRAALAGYLGSSRRFERALADFAAVYADQNAKDHDSLVRAIGAGLLSAVAGV